MIQHFLDCFRKLWVRGQTNASKLHTLRCVGYNLGLLMRKALGIANEKLADLVLALHEEDRLCVHEGDTELPRLPIPMDFETYLN